LLKEHPLAAGVEPIPDDTRLSSKLALVPETQNGIVATGNVSVNGITQKPPAGRTTESFAYDLIDVIVGRNERLTPSTHWQDVRLLSFTTTDVVSYLPGDILAIYPENHCDDVDLILRLMDWREFADLEVKIVSRQRISTQSALYDFQTKPTTLRELLTHHLDLNAIPRRSFFAMLAHFTTDKFQRDRLLEFTNPEFIDEFFDYATRPRRSIMEVLQEFDTVKLPWTDVLNILPELRPRQFSIASGGRMKNPNHSRERMLKSTIENNDEEPLYDYGTKFELLVAIVKYKTVIKKVRQGVCTRYLAGLQPGTRIKVSHIMGGLGITKAAINKPIVMVGPGTGVAPIRSLIWERMMWKDDAYRHNHNNGTGEDKLGESLLFYGCRNREADYFFHDEWNMLQEKIPLKVFAAFSRDQKQKVYVQDLIREQQDLVFRLLFVQNGILFVCGSSGKMPQAVREALVLIIMNCAKTDRRVAESYLARMEKENRYKQETW
jgi:sulfite reductase alpha subunit-like flavoprotein